MVAGPDHLIAKCVCVNVELNFHKYLFWGPNVCIGDVVLFAV